MLAGVVTTKRILLSLVALFIAGMAGTAWEVYSTLAVAIHGIGLAASIFTILGILWFHREKLQDHNLINIEGWTIFIAFAMIVIFAFLLVANTYHGPPLSL